MAIESMKIYWVVKEQTLAEMAGHPKLKLPVPPGFTVTTEVCTYYYDHRKTYPKNTRRPGLGIFGKDGKTDR